MKKIDPLFRNEDERIAATQPLIQMHTVRRLAELRREITEIELRTTALASIIADMLRTGEDITEAQDRGATTG